MRVILLGTGVPIPYEDRAESSLAIVTGDEILLFDCGYGTTQLLLKAGIDPTRLGTLFFTHHHYDHNSDYAHVVLSSWVMGRTRTIRVYGPEGTAHISRLLFQDIYAEDIRGRSTVGRPVAAAIPEVQDIAGGTVIAGGAWRVTALTVDHGPIPALGYVVEAEGKKVVISGDTRPVPAVRDAARGADLLVHEVIFGGQGRVPAGGRVDWETWVLDRGHTTPQQVGELAAAAGVPRLALTHLFPLTPATRADLERLVGQHYRGELIIGRDLLEITL